MSDAIPTYVPTFTPYMRSQDNDTIVLVLPDIHGVMVNVELSHSRFARLIHDGATILLTKAHSQRVASITTSTTAQAATR